jgi:GntR family transcriptional regulator
MANFPFQRLQADLAKLINKTPSGKRLLNEPELAKQMGVSRATLREAIRTFEVQGLIRRRQGSGTYVVGKIKPIDSGLEVLESIEAIAKRQGMQTTVSDLVVETLAMDEELRPLFKASATAKLTQVRRIIRAEGRPVAYLVDTLPENVLSADELPSNFNGSVLDFLLARGDTLTQSRADVSAIDATAEVAKQLEIQRDNVLLHFQSQLFNANAKMIDYSLSYFIPGYFHFHVVRKIGNNN